MNYFKFLFIALLTVGIFYGTSEMIHVSADDHFYEDYDMMGHDHHYYGYEKHENEFLEDVGKFIGWSSLVVFCIAGLIYPFRRILKIDGFQGIKPLTRFLGKNHRLIGFLALFVSITHGFLMYFSERKIDDDLLIGIVAVIFMGASAIIGLSFFKNRKVLKLKYTHTSFIVVTLLIILLHIFSS